MGLGSVNVPGASAADLVKLQQIVEAADTKAVKASEEAAAAKQIAESAQNSSSNAAATAIAAHNVNEQAHNDLRLALSELRDRVNDVLDSDDVTLDELHEIVAYIKSNKTLIDAVTTSKVSVSDIINDLITNASNKPLSAAQGVALKAMIEGLTAEDVGAANADLSNVLDTVFLAKMESSGGGGVKIAYGNYEGTGTSITESAPMTIVVGFKPKLFMCLRNSRPVTAPADQGSSFLWVGQTKENEKRCVTTTDDGLSFYYTQGSTYFNRSDETYYWFAIGE